MPPLFIRRLMEEKTPRGVESAQSAAAILPRQRMMPMLPMPREGVAGALAMRHDVYAAMLRAKMIAITPAMPRDAADALFSDAAMSAARGCSDGRHAYQNAFRYAITQMPLRDAATAAAIVFTPSEA
jgi:hypothetical protein